MPGDERLYKNGTQGCSAAVKMPYQSMCERSDNLQKVEKTGTDITNILRFASSEGQWVIFHNLEVGNSMLESGAGSLVLPHYH